MLKPIVLFSATPVHLSRIILHPIRIATAFLVDLGLQWLAAGIGVSEFKPICARFSQSSRLPALCGAAGGTKRLSPDHVPIGDDKQWDDDGGGD